MWVRDEDPSGWVFMCPRCGLEMDRQKLAPLDIYIKYTKMWSPPTAVSPMRGSCVLGLPQVRETDEVATDEGCPSSAKSKVDNKPYQPTRNPNPERNYR
ncbi:MAG: hypothetical protein QXV95_03635 [Sulfolobales archaeon]